MYIEVLSSNSASLRAHAKAVFGADIWHHWRQMGWDMKIDGYDDCGFVTEQVPTRTNIELKPGG